MITVCRSSVSALRAGRAIFAAHRVRIPAAAGGRTSLGDCWSSEHCQSDACDQKLLHACFLVKLSTKSQSGVFRHVPIYNLNILPERSAKCRVSSLPSWEGFLSLGEQGATASAPSLRRRGTFRGRDAKQTWPASVLRLGFSRHHVVRNRRRRCKSFLRGRTDAFRSRNRFDQARRSVAVLHGGEAIGGSYRGRLPGSHGIQLPNR